MKSKLIAGASTADITPPLKVGLLTSSVKGQWAPFESVRMPLKARAIVFGSGPAQLAIVSLDLIGLTDLAVGGWDNFKRRLSVVIPPERIIISCTHTHNSPEAIALTGLYATKAYKHWLEDLVGKIATAIAEAAGNAAVCEVSVGTTELQGFSLQRRIRTAGGVILSHSVQPVPKELMHGRPIDHRIHAFFITGANGSAIATIVHGVCHPVHEMCIPQVSPDYPGELCHALDRTSRFGMAMYLNGAAGDINPPTVSRGAAYAHKHGVALAEAAMRAGGHAVRLNTGAFAFANREIKLPVRFDGMERSDYNTYLNVVRLGSAAMVFLPGEPFVASALAIEKDSPFEKTVVVGYSESSIGYIPPEGIFSEGGYETHPGRWSFLHEQSESIIRENISDMLNHLYAATPVN